MTDVKKSVTQMGVEEGMIKNGYEFESDMTLPDGRHMQQWTNVNRGHAYLVIFNYKVGEVEFWSSAGVAVLEDEEERRRRWRK